MTLEDLPGGLQVIPSCESSIGAPAVPSRQELAGEIERTEALLSRLDAEQERTRKRLATLRAGLALLTHAEAGIRVHLQARPLQRVPRTSEEKVALFRQLFRGRTDV